ncbi:hypothetical protein ET475_08775 [Microbacterium protaetiae]|uniref:Uncharacterized protein n=1 Tax=Microbacterium protaetiae TaxID=2509458 RepID=A0A4P6ECV1_9MICO|nr:hypothetical protein [Microbacterium protaetiae]QAY60072.1 hypothetical protein ET475_08775 [Microbacterium protaetiae]
MAVSTGTPADVLCPGITAFSRRGVVSSGGAGVVPTVAVSPAPSDAGTAAIGEGTMRGMGMVDAVEGAGPVDRSAVSSDVVPAASGDVFASGPS